MNVVKTILEYFLHTSTWQGIVGIAVAAGINLAPELQTAIVTAGVSIVAAIQIFIVDHDKEKKVG